MQRNEDLVKHILLTIESHTGGKRLGVPNFVTDVFDEQTVAYHIGLLVDDFMIDGSKFNAMGQKYQQYIIKGLTSYGHNYLDEIR